MKRFCRNVCIFSVVKFLLNVKAEQYVRVDVKNIITIMNNVEVDNSITSVQ